MPEEQSLRAARIHSTHRDHRSGNRYRFVGGARQVSRYACMLPVCGMPQIRCTKEQEEHPDGNE